MKAVDVIAKILKAEGIEFFTCFPMNPILDAAAVIGIRPIVVRNERVALNMADGFTRMTSGRRIGVSVVQYGPGSENAFPGVAEAFSDSTPILCLAGANERSTLGVAPNFNSGRSYRPITKWCETVTDVERIPLMMQRAFSLLRSGKGGPVVLEFPQDIMMAEFPEAGFNYIPTQPSRPSPDRVGIKALMDIILRAKMPVIYAGQGVIYAEAWEELRGLCGADADPGHDLPERKRGFPGKPSPLDRHSERLFAVRHRQPLPPECGPFLRSRDELHTLEVHCGIPERKSVHPDLRRRERLRQGLPLHVRRRRRCQGGAVDARRGGPSAKSGRPPLRYWPWTSVR